MLSVLIKLSWFFKEQRKRYAFAIALLVVGGLLEVLPPRMIGNAIDRIATNQLSGRMLAVVLLELVGLTLLSYTINYFWGSRLFGGSFVVERLLRSKLMRHFLRMTPTFFERNRTGDLMARATNDLKSVSNTAGFGILTLVDSSEWFLLLVTVMAVTIDLKLTLMALIPLPFIALAMRFYGKKMHARFTEAQDAFGEMNDYVLEAVSGVRVIRAYVQEQASKDVFRAHTRDVFEKNMAVTRIDALFEPTIKILIGASYSIGIGYGAFLVFHHAITLGQLVSFNIYLGMVIWPMFAIGELINVMQRGNASLDRVEETLGYKADVQDVAGADKALPQAEPIGLSFDGVTFRYPSSANDNLQDVTFRLEPGQTLGLVGRTGSGKTTVIRQLLREYPSGEGDIRVSGRPIASVDTESWFARIGYVPQEHILFSKTVRENILFGAKAPDDAARLDEAIAEAELSKDLASLERGLETIVGEKGVALSGGQKQRVSIARALLGNPELLILDDALSAVDAKTEAAIIANIRSNRAGKTTIIATHRLSAVRHADLILVLENGRVIEKGTHEALMEAGGWYRTQFDRQQLEQFLTESG